MRFTSAQSAIRYYLNHQLMLPSDDMARLMVMVQYTVRGGTGRMWLGVELGNICRDLNERRLGKMAYLWAQYAYGDGRGGLVLAAYVLSTQLVTDETRDRLTALAACAVLNHAQMDGTGRAKLRTADMCRAAKIYPSNWARDWADVYRGMLDVCDGLAKRSLGVVADRLNRIADLEAA